MYKPAVIWPFDSNKGDRGPMALLLSSGTVKIGWVASPTAVCNAPSNATPESPGGEKEIVPVPSAALMEKGPAEPVNGSSDRVPGVVIGGTKAASNQESGLEFKT